ncbi:MAG: alpha-amylase family glycosyl hydrolase [Flavobacteriales bacterium]|nr:alpha-amylase family glycosyl hydrolase [Flavobacteriales bacterium]MDG2247156.1 alpha-amylase family glycosyl hydrolase [Flavobacteriales bacterium]
MKFPLVVLSLLLITSCADQTTEKEVVEAQQTHHDFIHGLASPIRMNAGPTYVVLSDYVQQYKNIDHVIFLGDTLEIDTISWHVVLTKQPQQAIAPLKVFVEGQRHDIPVFKTEKLRYKFQYTAEGTPKKVELAGNMNGWNPSATPLVFEDGLWKTYFDLDPGIYQYQVVVDGEWMLDQNNDESMSNGQGGFNSLFVVGDPNQRAPRLFTSTPLEGSIPIAINTPGTIHIWWEDLYQGEMAVHPGADTVWVLTPPEIAKEHASSTLRAWIENDNIRGNDIVIPLKNGVPVTSTSSLPRTDPHKWIMYFLMVDRFYDGDSTINFPVDDPSILPIANHFGGDLKGVQDQLNNGYFDELGVNTIWVSPIAKNAEGAWGLWDKGVTSTFSGYHGYWPISSSEIDPNFGTEASFKELISSIHDDDMNIIVDYVANHVHENHPVYQQNNSWATPLYLPDGRMNTELWDEQRLTTWFDTFLPTLNLEDPVVAEAMTDSALFWLDNYDIDGFRHDATKHIPQNFWRQLTLKAKDRYLNPDQAMTAERTSFQIGETYGNPELISSYVSSGMLDAQFDFNLYDACVDAFAKDFTSFENLERVLEESLHFYGSHHLMGNITGNQDRVRFTSYADGSVKFSEDGKLVGWTRTIENTGNDGFDKMCMLQAFILTSPGIPCIYYGDEIGMPGGNDPDNRRMMLFDELNNEQLQLRNNVAQLAQLRQDRMSLIYGDLVIKEAESHLFSFSRIYLGEVTYTTIYKGEPKVVPVEQITGSSGNEVLFLHNAELQGDMLSLSPNAVIITGN